MEVQIPYIRPIVQAYFLGNIPTKYGQKYGTNVPPFQDPGDLPLTDDQLIPTGFSAWFGSEAGTSCSGRSEWLG